MKYFLFPACLILAALLSKAQSPDSLAVFAYWKKGDHKVYNVTHSKAKQENGNPREGFSLDLEAEITVTDSSEKGYHLEWRFRLPEELGLQAEQASILTAYNNMKIIFTTSPEGSFLDLLNWEEVVDGYIKMAELSIPAQKDDTSRQVMEKVKAMFHSKQAAETALIREVQLFCAAYGSLFTEKGLTGEALLPNPFGGEPMPSAITQRIMRNDPAESHYDVSIDQGIKPEAMRNLMLAMVQRLDVPVDSLKIHMDSLLKEMDISDKLQLRMDRETGWPVRLQFIRQAKIAGMQQREEYLFEKKKAP